MKDTVDIYQVIYQNCVCVVCVYAYANWLPACVYTDLENKENL